MVAGAEDVLDGTGIRALSKGGVPDSACLEGGQVDTSAGNVTE